MPRPKNLKVIEVLQTSPGGKYIVRNRRPFAIYGKGLTKPEARNLAVACYRQRKRLGLTTSIVVI